MHTKKLFILLALCFSYLVSACANTGINMAGNGNAPVDSETESSQQAEKKQGIPVLAWVVGGAALLALASQSESEDIPCINEAGKTVVCP